MTHGRSTGTGRRAAVAAVVAGAALALFAVAAMAAEETPSRAVLAPAEEPGEVLILAGTIFQEDGATPAAGAELDLWQTDASGHYSPDGGAAPRLKGRLRTGPDGRYELRTIRPGHYPNARIPAHIHARLSAPGGAAADIPEFWFEGDPFVTAEMAAPLAAQGRFSPLVQLTKGSDGVWRGLRDIRLPARRSR
jgi:protocatechuate 3,4-dioxygenase beta subunit